MEFCDMLIEFSMVTSIEYGMIYLTPRSWAEYLWTANPALAPLRQIDVLRSDLDSESHSRTVIGQETI